MTVLLAMFWGLVTIGALYIVIFGTIAIVSLGVDALCYWSVKVGPWRVRGRRRRP